jgi:hypothetical protein
VGNRPDALPVRTQSGFRGGTGHPCRGEAADTSATEDGGCHISTAGGWTVKPSAAGLPMSHGQEESVTARYPDISDHGLIGDLQTAALVTTDGTVDCSAVLASTRQHVRVLA